MSVSRESRRHWKRNGDASAMQDRTETGSSNRMTLWEQLLIAQGFVTETGDPERADRSDKVTTEKVDTSRASPADRDTADIIKAIRFENSLNDEKEPQGLLKALRARERLLIESYNGDELKWLDKIKVAMRFFVTGKPWRCFRRSQDTDYINSVVERAGYSVFYGKGRKR